MSELPYKLTELGLEVLAPLHFETWELIGENLGNYAKGIPWMIGDWLAYGSQRTDWGDRYTEATQITGLEYGTLANYKSTASRIPIENRRSDLSYSHHAEVVHLDRVRQREVLEYAAAQRLSVGDLRYYVRGGKIDGEIGKPGGETLAGYRTPARHSSELVGVPASVPDLQPGLNKLEVLKRLYNDLDFEQKEEFLDWVTEKAAAQ